MTKVTCSVESCTYNQREVCCADHVHISEQGIIDEVLICCNSYVNKNTCYNGLEEAKENSPTMNVGCRVGNCIHYQNNQCTLAHIQIEGHKGAHTYIETKCIHFEKR